MNKQKLFYTNVVLEKNIIHHWYINTDGVQKHEIIKPQPSVAIPTEKKSKFKNIFGKNLKILNFRNTFEYYKWRKENKKHIPIYNDVGIVYEFLSDQYPHEIKANIPLIKTFIIDIEVISNTGFPDPTEARYPITSIAVQDYHKDVHYVFGLQPYNTDKGNVYYVECDDEFDLITKFLKFFRKAKPQILVTFNGETFDIPYIVNRFKQVLPDQEYLKLSPINDVRPYNVKDAKKSESYKIIGITHYDFQVVYKKMNLKKLDGYSLDNIAKVETGKGKLDFKSLGYKNHYDFYHGDFNKFIDYNIRDNESVADINRKKRFIEIAITKAYMTKTCLDDALGSVKPWDIYVYNENKKLGVCASPKSDNIAKTFPGGYHMEPMPGMVEYTLLSDIKSSYPNSIISANISPETHVPSNQLPEELFNIQTEIKKQNWGSSEHPSTGFIDIEKMGHITELLQKHNLSMSANGEFFRKDIIGVFPTIGAKVYNKRVSVQTDKKKYEAERDKCEKNSDEWKKWDDLFSAADNEQYALKIFLNSFFGTFGNAHFRYFDTRLASAVTTNSQMAVKGPTKYIEDKFPNVKVRYTVTDSLFIDLTQVMKDRYGQAYDTTPMEEKRDFCMLFWERALSPLIKQYYVDYTTALNFPQNTYEMNFEIIADKTLYIKKGRYIMNIIYDEGKLFSSEEAPLKIKGVEINRVNTPMYARNKLRELVELIMKTSDNDLCLDFIDKFRKDFKNEPFDVVARPTGVNGLSEYELGQKGIPIHVRASKIYNKALEDLDLINEPRIYNGEKIHYAYIKEPNKFRSNVIAAVTDMPKEIADYIEVDYETHFYKVALKPIEDIMKTLGWKTEKSASLDQFF